ncbi:MAG: cytochrome P450 [Pseudomonadales bacterium]|nr:cytochrome P450 [Pseudomonadales bacterium]
MEKEIDLATARLPGDTLHHLLAQWRRESAVHTLTFFGMPAYALLSYDAVKTALQDKTHFPPETIYQLSIEPAIGRTFLSMPDPEHQHYRQLSTPAFKLKAVAGYNQAWLEGICHELIDALQPGDNLIEKFIYPYPLIIISRMLGLPLENEKQFQRWATGLLGFRGNPARALQCGEELKNFIQPLIRQARVKQQDNVLSALVHSEIEGKHLTDEEIVSHIRLLLPTGAETTFQALGNLLYGLHKNLLWQQLVEYPALQTVAIEEGLRWESPLPLMPRMTGAADFDFFGKTLKANCPVFFGIASAHRDENHFIDGDLFLLNRSTETSSLLTFGPGFKTCPGMHLARKELAIALKVLCERTPDLVLDTDCPPEGCILRGPARLAIRAGL